MTRLLSSLGTGKRYFRTSCIRPPSGELKFSKMRCGYCSDTVEFLYDSMSCRRVTLWRVKNTVGPWGKWETIIASGVEGRMRQDVEKEDVVLTWYTAVFVEDNKVCHIVCPASICQLFYDVVSSVDSM